MKMVEVECFSCGKLDDALQRGNEPFSLCSCGGQRRLATRVREQDKANGVHGDDIPGGMTFKHGICWPDGTPRTFYTRHEIEDAKRKAGLLSLEDTGTQIPVLSDEIARNLDRPGFKQAVRVMSVPGSLSPEDEAARVKHWHEHERRLAMEPVTPAPMTPYDSATALLKELDK